MDWKKIRAVREACENLQTILDVLVPANGLDPDIYGTEITFWPSSNDGNWKFDVEYPFD